MSLNSLFGDLSARLRSAKFLLHAAHPDHPSAFTRQRKLPLPALVALMLTGMRKSIQAELDEFFAHLNNQAQLVRTRARLRAALHVLWQDKSVQSKGLAPFPPETRSLAGNAAEPKIQGFT